MPLSAFAMSPIRGAISTQSTRRRPQERNRCLRRRRTAGSSNLRRPCSLPRSGRRDIRRHLLSTPRWSESASQIRGTTSDSRLDASLSSLSCLDLSVDPSRTIQAQNTWTQGFCRNARCAPRLCKQLLTPKGEVATAPATPAQEPAQSADQESARSTRPRRRDLLRSRGGRTLRELR